MTMASTSSQARGATFLCPIGFGAFERRSVSPQVGGRTYADHTCDNTANRQWKSMVRFTADKRSAGLVTVNETCTDLDHRGSAGSVGREAFRQAA